MRLIALLGTLLGILMTYSARPACAQPLDKEQRAELQAIQKSLTPLTRLISKKEFEEAEKILDAAQKGVDRIAKFAKLPPDSPLTARVRKVITLKRHALEVRRDPEAAKKASMVSFVKHVAPILNAKCVKCHAESPQGGLSLNTYELMKKGGRSGPLLIPGNARTSLFVLRLCTPDPKARMPRNQPPLTMPEKNVLALWIQQGARYDAEHEDTELEELVNPPDDLPPLQGWKPTGKESVSFKRHVSPWLVTYCLRCHSGKNPRGGLSLESYDALMRGGDSGLVIKKGRPEESPIYQLVGSFDATRRMPANTSRLLRKDWDNLGVWIHEGAKFDGGDDPKILIRALTPSPEDITRDKLASLTPDAFIQYRESRTAAQWKQGFPQTPPEIVVTTDLLVYGNLPAEQMEKLEEQTVAHLAKLRELFGIEEADKSLWKGRLAVFLVSSRAEFEKFATDVTQRRVFDDNYSVSRLATNGEDMYLVLYDPGEPDPDDPRPSLPFMLLSELTRAYLDQTGKTFPQWFRLGLGPALVAREGKGKDPWVLAQQVAAVGPLKEIKRPADIFKDGAFFSEEDARPVSMTLVEFLLEKGGGEKKLTQFIAAFQESGSGNNSLQFVYRSTLEGVARGYAAWLEAKTRNLIKQQTSS